MKTRILTFIILLLALGLPLAIFADDVLPAVSKDEMGQYQNAFGKAVAASQAEARKEGLGASRPPRELWGGGVQGRPPAEERC